jgi:hypothetical protein
VSAKRFFSEGIEFTGLYIGLELAIPGFGIERGIPAAKSGKLVRRQLLLPSLSTAH